MASRCCGSRLSLPNQYDTKTPRARPSERDCQAVCFSLRAVRCPSRFPRGICSRHENIQSAGIEMSVENFICKKISKDFFGAPERRRTRLPNFWQSLFKANTCWGRHASRPVVQVPCGHYHKRYAISPPFSSFVAALKEPWLTRGGGHSSDPRGLRVAQESSKPQA